MMRNEFLNLFHCTISQQFYKFSDNYRCIFLSILLIFNLSAECGNPIVANSNDIMSFNTSVHFDRLNKIAQCKFIISGENEVIGKIFQSQECITSTFRNRYLYLVKIHCLKYHQIG